MKYIVVRLKPDSLEMLPTPMRCFDSWSEASTFIDPLQRAGERGWRIIYAWEKGEEIPPGRKCDGDDTIEINC